MGFQSTYMVNSLFIAGLVFLLTYIALMIYEFRPLQNFKFRDLLGGALFGIAISFVMLLLQAIGLRGMPDGRLIIIGLSAYFWGPLPGFVTALIVTLTASLAEGSSTLYNLVIALFQIALFSLLKKQYGSKLSPVKLTLFSFIIPLTAIATASFAMASRLELRAALENLPSLFLLTMLLMGSLTFAIFREFDRTHHITAMQEANDNLSAQNDEIRALYEEMAASEETLQDNYDELSRIHEEMSESDERYRLVLLASEEGFWDYHPAAGRVEVSESFCKIFGITRCENPFRLHQLLHKLHSDDRQKLNWLYSNDFSLMSNKNVFSAEVRVQHPDGNYRWVALKAFAQIDKSGRISRITGSVSDIHEKVLQQEKVAYYAFHDPLTGFFNRDHLLENITVCLKNPEAAQIASLLIISIRGLDRYRSTLGQTRCDILHYQVGLLIREASGTYQFDDVHTLAQGRFGLLLRNNWEKIAMEKMVSNLKSLLKNPLQIQSMDLNVSLGFGLLAFSDATGERESGTLLTLAEGTCDYALSQTKGDALVWYTKAMDDERQYQSKAEHFMTRAMANDELYMVYQPQFDGRQNIVGFEALIRWQQPELGAVRPDFFIPLAERSGYIETLGEFVMDQACQFIVSCKEAGIPTPRVAINASFLELMNPHYVERLNRCVMSHGLLPPHLIIEITETAISAFLDDVVETLQCLMLAGYEVHLDDFGTGYSSLNHLGRLPVSTLKIDRGFIVAMENDPRMRSLTQLIVQIAQQLELSVIAEGVETLQQHTLLEEMGCHHFQGYYFARPMRPEAILADSNLVHHILPAPSPTLKEADL